MPRPKDRLESYRDKRDFTKTPEPKGDRPDDAPLQRFVIHRHDAQRLHYDLRLESDGVLVSFAIPKGFSFNPRDKHLAIHTEDHPMSYETFEGVIPKGEYGAGPMAIWDRGTYSLVASNTLAEAMKRGEVKVSLDGGRVRGEWHLVKTKRGPRDWLLFKTRDVYARDEGDPRFPIDFSRARRQTVPKRPKAMQPDSANEPFADDAWLFELAFSGKRLIARYHAGSVRWLDPGGTNSDVDIPQIERDLTRLRWSQGLLDGVLVALDETHRPDLHLLEQRLEAGDSDDLVFYAFDLIHYDHWSLRRLPTRDRKRALASIIPSSSRILYTDHVQGRGDALFETVESLGLGGMLAKRADAPYRSGLSDDWLYVSAGDESDSKTDVIESLSSRRPSPSTRVRISNRSKIYWPDERITKGQLIDYYAAVADDLLPYLRHRPVHLLRYPDGIQGKSFYHKRFDTLPDWVETTEVRVKDGESIRYVVCNDHDTLIYLVNLGSIDLHPWLSTCRDLDSPDVAVIDLDPSDVDFSKVVTIARTVGKLLSAAGLRGYPKTSGASGLHVYIPLAPGYSYEQSAMLCEIIARLAVREHRDIATVERSVSQREKRVYVDYLQNRREQTIVPPYAVRPVAGASVSTPLDWDELSFDLHPSQHTIHTVVDRLRQRGDLFEETLDGGQDLMEAVGRLQDAIDGTS